MGYDAGGGSKLCLQVTLIQPGHIITKDQKRLRRTIYTNKTQ